MSIEPYENTENFNEDVGLFEAATHAAIVDIPSPELKTITLALDGSDGEETARQYAEAIAARTGARIDELTGSNSVADVIAAITSNHSELLILPVPFGQDYRELSNESLGSAADQLLLKSKCPVLCVREPQERAAIDAALASVMVPLAVNDELVPRLGWGFRITPDDGRIDLVAVADRDVLAEAAHLLPESADACTLAPEHLTRALLRDIGGLVSAAQKRGGAEGRTIHVETRIGQFVPLVLKELHGKPHLIIWGITRDHSSPAFHRAVDLLLMSAGPVLMV